MNPLAEHGHPNRGIFIFDGDSNAGSPITVRCAYGLPPVVTHGRTHGRTDGRTDGHTFKYVLLRFDAKINSDQKLLFYDPPQFDPGGSESEEISSLRPTVGKIWPRETTEK
jgi:hypothetical protein